MAQEIREDTKDRLESRNGLLCKEQTSQGMGSFDRLARSAAAEGGVLVSI